MFKFITSRPLWVNIIAAAVLAFLMIFLILQLLSWITSHGEYLTVPSVTGKKTKDAVQLLEKSGFEVQISDSVYTDTAANGIVLKQLPDPNATVKVNRTIFLTVNREVPPLIEMPNLEGLSLRFALDLLERNHLKLQDTIFQPNFMAGAIIEQQYRGTKIPEKAKLPWGSKITLVVGAGLEDKQIMVPDVIGMTYGEAKTYLEENGIFLGLPITEGAISDTNAAYVWKQNPPRYNEEKIPNYIHSGQVMDLFIASQMKYESDSLENKKNKIKTKKEND